MANLSSSKPDFSGQTALAGIASSTSANPDGGAIGLVFGEMAHLGKLNLRGQNGLAKAVKAITGCTFPPKANRFQSAGDAMWFGLAPMNICYYARLAKNKSCKTACIA